jgi:hypothetical protein
VVVDRVNALELELKQARLDGERAVAAAQRQWHQRDREGTARILDDQRRRSVLPPIQA